MGRKDGTRRRRLGIAGTLACALLALALATAAHAHHGEPATGEDEFGTLGAQNTGGTLSTDTELSPVAKDGAAAGWQQIAGSLWRADGSITDLATPDPGQDSPTPYDLDFYGVGFLKVDVAMANGRSREDAGIEAQTSGFAVGAQCRREDPAQPVPAEAVPGCKRIPVIYRYYEHPTKGLIWEESYRGSDKEDPGGFVAAVTWLTPDRALAVGGTGTYPRREQELSPEQISTCESEALAVERMAIEEGAADAPEAAVEAAQQAPGTAATDVGPAPTGLGGTVPLWLRSATFNAGRFEAAYQSPSATNHSASATTPLASGGAGAGSASASLINGALEADVITVETTNDSSSITPTRRARRGVYERALEECAARKRAENDIESGAGTARAWLYTQDPETKAGSWREIAELPTEMRALHAVDASPRPKDCGMQVEEECAIAGGMRQLWHFADGRFTRGYGPELGAPPGEGMRTAPGAFNSPPVSPANFRFRVRDIRFAPNWRRRQAFGWIVEPAVESPPPTSALAVTAGCCSVDRSADRPAQLFLDASGWSAVDREWVSAFQNQAGYMSNALGDSGSFNPDSYYAVTVLREKGPVAGIPENAAVSALLAPGGPSERYAPREPPSRLTYVRAPSGGSTACDTEGCAISSTLSAGGSVPAPGTTLSTLRLVSADGDSRGFNTQEGAGQFPDASPDWAVGVLRSSGRGVAYHTAFGANREGSYFAKWRQCEEDEALVVAGQSESTNPCNFEAYQRKNASKALYALGSYALNAYRVAGEDPIAGAQGTGWAVGDHGAIATRGGGVASAEASPARRGARISSEPVPGADAFDGQRAPVSDEPGSVPALVPGARAAEPGFTEGQMPFDGSGFESLGNLIAMSRDGSEGWAWGAPRNTTNIVYRYDGAAWAPCDTKGVPGLVPADPACKELDGLAFRALARVPLERDSDPANDDEFEAVALTGQGLYRYREGRWFLDPKATYKKENDFGTLVTKDVTGTDIAFTAPDDGWVVNFVATSISRATVEVFHFDGTQWANCTPRDAFGNFLTSPAACDDPGGHLKIRAPCAGASVGLATAGERVYLFSVRDLGASPLNPTNCSGTTAEPYPLILYHDRGGAWVGGWDATDDGTYNPADGGWDPAFCAPNETQARCLERRRPEHQGRVESLSVAQDGDGSYAGWATGVFGGTERESADAVMLRLSDGADVPEAGDAGESAWRQWTVRDAANEYLRFRSSNGQDPSGFELLALPAEAGRRSAFLSITGKIGTAVWGFGDQGWPPLLGFDRERGRWAAVPTPWSVSPPHVGLAHTAGAVRAISADGRGGFWAVVAAVQSPFGSDFLRTAFYRYTDSAPAEPFSEVPDPSAGSSRLTAMGAGADGTLWLGDEHGSLYRYDRLAGWSRRLRVPGWDPPRTTRPAGINAIAAGPGGSGVAVGPGGRIADLGSELRLDLAATVGCDPQNVVPPCGTGSDLNAAAVAPDGSAIVAGDRRALLWRPAGGDFRPIAPPPVPLATPIVDVEMPRADRAYLVTKAGTPASRIVAGRMSAPGSWSWRIEVGDSGGGPDPLLAGPTGSAIHDIAVDGAGHGFAVGDSGIVLERTGEGEWRRLPRPDQEGLRAVALPAGGGPGALIGGEGGRILTWAGDRFEVARHADPFDPVEGDVVALALVPGHGPGEVEGWALREALRRDVFHTRDSGQALLHYPSEPTDPRLDPARRIASLPDAPASREGEIAFAAFGKQECDAVVPAGIGTASTASTATGQREACGPPSGANITAELIARRVREELAARPADESRPRFALFTGDAVDKPGGREAQSTAGIYERTPLDMNLKHRRWVELVADPLAEQGLAVFGAIGGQDLGGEVEQCHAGPTGPNFRSTRSHCFGPFSRVGVWQLGVRGGANLAWRATMASAPAPWEREQEAGGLRFERVGAGALSQQVPGETPELRAGSGSAARADIEGYRLDAGDTHYAVDAIDEATDEKVARIVVVDTSMGSIAASDPQQHPIEAGGQLRWLEEVLCFEGSAEDTDGDVRDCTREPGQQAIVLSNTPTYSYGPISPEETQTDAAAFEAVLLKNQVNVVVSGRLGWNGRYWAIAPGVHAPCPGQDYRPDSQAPSLDRPEICGASGVGGTQDVVPDPNQVIDELPEDAKEAAGLAGRGALPFVVSSTAGGRFNEKAVRGGFATAENGFWRGYSIVRLSPDGDPAKTIVEQRPILDWVGLSTHDPTVAPGQKLQLQSYAREAFGLDTAPRYYEIPETQVITHRYHLLLADPGEPWRACEASDSTCQAYYSKLASNLSSRAEASQSDAVAEGSQSASATSSPLGSENPCEPYLCLPERVGTIDPDAGEVRAGNGKYPDTFALATLSVGEHVAVQPLVFTKSSSFVLSAFGQPPAEPAPGASVANAPTAPAPPSAPKPPIPQVNTPEPPLPPAVPPIAATQPPEPQPPAPPAPPPPTEQPSPLNLTLAPPGITVATPTAVIQPPTPPVNPAPPGGARREARQRQAAAQKSGADSEGGSEIQDAGGDKANAPQGGGFAFARHERTRPEPSFTALSSQDQPSAWAQGALYTGGIALVAFALAAGWSRGRPTPRRRQDITPAPGWARARQRR